MIGQVFLDLFGNPVTPEFNGSDYVPSLDKSRLTGQILDIFNLMRDGRWRTLSEIEHLTGHVQASISAQLRHMRKERFGGHIVNKRSRGERENGLFEYQLIINDKN
jgi:hypothetical protein